MFNNGTVNKPSVGRSDCIAVLLKLFCDYNFEKLCFRCLLWGNPSESGVHIKGISWSKLGMEWVSVSIRWDNIENVKYVDSTIPSYTEIPTVCFQLQMNPNLNKDGEMIKYGKKDNEYKSEGEHSMQVYDWEILELFFLHHNLDPNFISDTFDLYRHEEDSVKEVKWKMNYSFMQLNNVFRLTKV